MAVWPGSVPAARTSRWPGSSTYGPRCSRSCTPDSGELVINDFTEDGSDDLVVVDVASGELIDRVATGSRIANGMFLTAGDDRDVYYCTTTTLARVSWR